jgi:lysophospholipase L1-like esterase
VLYGACILPYLREAGFEDGDGYVYVYGQTSGVGCRSLCVARVLPEKFADWMQWRFFDGETFVDDIARSRPLLDHISCEMSVTPVLRGKRKGQFLAVFQYDTKSRYVAYAYGQTPWGPFTEARKVYRGEEEALHKTAYLYNAKVHNHLSYPDKVLASYNVNATDPAGTDANGHLYLPRFVLLEDTSTDPLERLFSDAFTQRVGLFHALNRHARPGGAVLAGDSLIQEFPVEELLGGTLPIYNRGIGADTTAGLLGRLEESVLALRPSRVFLLIGTNDIAFGASDDAIQSNHGQMLRRIAQELPGCRVHVVSLLPVNGSGHPKISADAVGNRTNERIAQVNARLRAVALQHGATFVDAHDALADSHGLLALPYTREGLHLSPEGYEVLAAILRPYLS